MIYAYLFLAFEIGVLVFFLGVLTGAAVSERYERRHRGGWDIDRDFARLDRQGRIRA